MKRAHKFSLLAAIACLALSACAVSPPTRETPPLSEKTNQQIIDEYKPKLIEFRDTCNAIYQLIAKSKAPATDPDPIKGLNPVPFTNDWVDSTSPLRSNTDVIMYEELKDPDNYFASSMDFQKSFRQERSPNFGQGGQTDQWFYAFDQCTDKAYVVNDDPSFKQDMIPTKKPKPADKALKLCAEVVQYGPPKYLGVVRVTEYKEPKITEDANSSEKFDGVAGIAKYECYFVDVPSGKILGSFSGTATNRGEVTAKVDKNRSNIDGQRELQSEADTQLRDAARSDIYAKFAKLTGANLERTE